MLGGFIYERLVESVYTNNTFHYVSFSDGFSIKISNRRYIIMVLGNRGSIFVRLVRMLVWRLSFLILAGVYSRFI